MNARGEGLCRSPGEGVGGGGGVGGQMLGFIQNLKYILSKKVLLTFIFNCTILLLIKSLFK